MTIISIGAAMSIESPVEWFEFSKIESSESTACSLTPDKRAGLGIVAISIGIATPSECTSGCSEWTDAG